MLKSLRIALASVSFVLITALFLDFTGVAQEHFGWLAKIQFIPALLSLNFLALVFLSILTLLLGRVYCSVICPLGVMQDIINRIRGSVGKKSKRKNRFRFKKALPVVRFVFLALFVVCVAFGFMSMAALIEPYSEFGRIVSTFFAPVYDWANNMLADAAQARDSYMFYHVPVQFMFGPAMIVAGITFLIVALFAWLDGRGYCNSVCPVGTILGYASKFSIFKPVINPAVCNGCSKCSRNCKSSCIDYKQHKIDYSRCVACMDCLGVCAKDAIKYTYKRYDSETSPSRAAVDGGRRTFIALSGIMAGAALAKAEEKVTDGGFAAIIPKEKPVRKYRISPPGSRSHSNLERKCTSCQLCIASCPNEVLRPSMELETFMQPEVSYERGYCRPECVRCSEVCPSGAIVRIESPEKSSTQIGQAVVNHENCLAASQGVKCGKCSVKCPVQAIVMVASPSNDSVLIPAVNESLCIGCGACEHLCPVSPQSAIVVHGHEVHRLV
ncbi:MAG: 4Fe-4S dicluster domain-containing protein [Muribaculaceae bacterium]|nr:4Fe-4S dicluster domain-containing protein [Muribaculaceae bacterium]